jgi:hypothetical protein
MPEPAFDLDEALPYAVALRATGSIEPHLKSASARGYAPAWFARSAGDGSAGVPFYAYWAVLHTSVGSSSSSGGGVSGSVSAGSSSGGGSF